MNSELLILKSLLIKAQKALDSRLFQLYSKHYKVENPVYSNPYLCSLHVSYLLDHTLHIVDVIRI